MKVLTIVALLILGVFYMELTACNPKGSIAAQINWAGNKVCDG